MKVELKGADVLANDLLDAAKLEEAKKTIKYHTSLLDGKAKARAVFVKGYSTGHTRRSIEPTLKDDGLTGVVTAHSEYSGYLEVGTRFMDAQPFMRPALHEVEHQFIADMKRIEK